MITGAQQLHISVVMPSFNHARFIRAAIESVLSQDYPFLDLLVMDGGSSDETLQILNSYGDRIRFISQKDNGQCDAINRGLKQVTGDVLCWLNSDDLFTPGAIQRVAAAFSENPEVEFVYGKGWTIDEAGELRGDSGVLPLEVWKLIHQRNFIQQPSCFFRRSLFERVGAIDESLSYVMDWELWIRFAAYSGLFIDAYLSCNREYAQNKTQRGQFQRWREIKNMVRRYTRRRWPPVVWLYLIEATIQKARTIEWLKWIDGPLSYPFGRGMLAEMSGHYPDGGVRSTFYVSIGNPSGRTVSRWRFAPLSRYDSNRLAFPLVTLRWRNDCGARGRLSLLENGRTQEFTLPLSPGELFTHFAVRADSTGVALDPPGKSRGGRIVAFLEDAKPSN